MYPRQQRATLTITLLDAFADGANDDRERVPMRPVPETLGESGVAAFARLSREGLLTRASLEAVAATLNDAKHRQLAYETALRISSTRCYNWLASTPSPDCPIRSRSI